MASTEYRSKNSGNTIELIQLYALFYFLLQDDITYYDVKTG